MLQLVFIVYKSRELIYIFDTVPKLYVQLEEGIFNFESWMLSMKYYKTVVYHVTMRLSCIIIP